MVLKGKSRNHQEFIGLQDSLGFCEAKLSEAWAGGSEPLVSRLTGLCSGCVDRRPSPQGQGSRLPWTAPGRAWTSRLPTEASALFERLARKAEVLTQEVRRPSFLIS